MLKDIPRGVEVLVKKAAVDPAFKKMLLEKRAAAAKTIALKLEPAEAAMLDAVPLPQLEAIVAKTKVSPKLRPAFLGYAAGVMLAALGVAAYAKEPDESEMRTTGVDAETAPKAETAGTGGETEPAAKAGTVSGIVTDENGQPLSGALVVVTGANRYATTNADGYYVIQKVPVGTFDVKASRVGYDTQTQEPVKIVGDIRTNLSFVLTRDPNWREPDYAAALAGKVLKKFPECLVMGTEYGTVAGVVRRVGGRPLENVEVIIVGTGLTTLTNEYGYFELSHIPEGTYEVKFTHDELGTKSETDVRVIKGIRIDFFPFYLGD